MSRSYKKFPSYSDGNKHKKQIANRALRQHQLEIDEDTIFYKPSEMVNDYDYKFTDYSNNKKYIKYKRK